MKCPLCNDEMEAFFKDISSDPKNGRKYNRTYYNCEKDDTWISVEIPVQEERLA